MSRFAVFDLARAIPLRAPLGQMRPPHGDTLLDRERFPDLLPVGPWIVDLTRNPHITRKWQREGRWKAWGYVVHSSFTLETLRRHFRKFNLVELEGQKDSVFFRYYDPEVLIPFIRDIADLEQRKAFLGPLEAIDVEDRETMHVMRFDCSLWM